MDSVSQAIDLSPAQSRAFDGAVLSAAETIRRNQERYREAESRVRTRDRTRPPWFSTSFDFTESEPAD